MTAEAAGRRILVVEDDYFIAKGLMRDLRDLGCEALGPAASVAEALELAAAGPLDGALLDINLRGEPAYPVADALVGRGVPVAFATGYDADAIPPRYAAVPRCEKPVRARDALAVLFGPAR